MTTKDAAYRKRVRQAFKAGKIYLALTAKDLNDSRSRKDEFICLALNIAENHGHIDERQHNEAKKVIMDRIGWHHTACCWLRDAIGEDAVKKAGPVAVQEWRHRWVDSLINEFSSAK